MPNISIRKTVDLYRFTLYALFTCAMLFLSRVGNNAEPLAFALAYALCSARLSFRLTPFLYFATAFLSPTVESILIHAGQALLLWLAFAWQARLANPKNEFPSLLALSLGLGAYIAFAPFTSYRLPVFPTLTPIMQKAVVCALVFLCACVFSVAIKALLFKFLKCRLRGEETVFCLFFFVLVGVGICRFLGVNAYTGIAFFVLLVFCHVTGDASGLVCAFVISLPPALTAGLGIERFFLYGVAVTLFSKVGRLPAALALSCVFFLYGFQDGLFYLPTAPLTKRVLSLVLPALFFVILPTPIVRSLQNALVFYREKHLSRVAINRNRAAIGEQLFEVSAVFREIGTTFLSLGNREAEESAREFVRNQVVEESCKKCAQYRNCARGHIFPELDKLVAVGCMKGKANLMDLPRRVAEVCVNQSDLLYAVNRRLIDYRKYTLEAENAADGRALLANQAQGVSEILKNLAVEQSEPLRIYTDKEHALGVALASAGIVSSEVLVYGDEDNPTLSLVTFGKADVKKIATIASNLFRAKMIISERIALSQDKFCCILRKKPRYDAAFGVASVKKAGERVSGDTHSVIRIDERRFMVALSDGMGSGEYAHRVSESTISLLESFYRAKMPPESVLSTINKILTFNKEETFACVDVALVNLDDGKADIVKIGSPVGFIITDSAVKVLDASSLPLGILDSLRPDASSYELAENDVLLFLSDGVTDAFGSTADLYETLKSVPVRNPQELADALIDRALGAYGGKAKDDMTALAVRLFSAA